MRERPILFSAPMIKALLAGTKTQTRRVVKAIGTWGPMSQWTWNSVTATEMLGDLSPYGVPGDCLWVKETWAAGKGYDADPSKGLSRAKPTDINKPARIWYRADDVETSRRGQWRPSLFMRRWMSRITLEITHVRIERLNAISPSDAIAEGIKRAVSKNPNHGVTPGWWDYERNDGREAGASPVHSFRTLWESINGAGSWDANPWVWVVEFERVTP